MKFLLFLFLLIPTFLQAQPPQGINYQAVIRDDAGDIVANQSMLIVVEIEDPANNDAVVYRESHNMSTNAFGQLELVIGQGNATLGDFETIDWVNSELSVDLTLRYNNEEYELPATPFQSVPYALNADNPWIRDGDDIYYDEGNVAIGTDQHRNQLVVARSGTTAITIMATNASDSYLELLRGGTGTSFTDWRMNNDGGALRFQLDDDAFVGATTNVMSLSSSGRMTLGNTTGAPSANLHIRGNEDQTLRLTANATGAEAGMELQAIGADFRITNEAGRFRLQRSTNNFTTNTDVLDVQTDGTLRIRQDLNMADQQIVNVADPTGAQHVVNRRYLEDFVGDQIEMNRSVFPEDISTQATNMTFAECAFRCRTLTEGGHDDWGIPSVEQLSQFVNGNPTSSSFSWTSTADHSRSQFAHRINGGIFDPPPVLGGSTLNSKIVIRLTTGETTTAEYDEDQSCFCVR
ncbi:MAG: hypothetical protein AAF741_10815 [Bacteroidota bacterium]